MPVARVRRDDDGITGQQHLHGFALQLVATYAGKHVQHLADGVGVQLVRAPGVNVTFEARMRDGASGANTSSCSTAPVKLAVGARLVGRAAARTILERILLSLVWSCTHLTNA